MKTIQKIALIILTLGWFPFMWVCIYASKTENKDIVMFVILTGLFFCILGSTLSMTIFSNKLFWKKQEQYDKEIEKYRMAKQKYEKSTLQFAMNQKITNEVSNQSEKRLYTLEEVKCIYWKGVDNISSNGYSEYDKSELLDNLIKNLK